jgi:hypothetical protein
MILFKVLTKKFVKDATSQFQSFHANFHKFHALSSIRLSVMTGHHKFCTLWILKMLTGVHKTQRMALALTFFLERYHKDGNEFLSHSIQVTGDETCISFVNVEIKQQSKQWMHTHSPNKLKKFKQISARKLIATGFWDGKGVLMVEFME